MATYIVLSQLDSDAYSDPKEFKQLAADVSQKIKQECPAVTWRYSYATMGQFDVVDVLESDDPVQVEKAAMIIRAYGHATTETFLATPWGEFLDAL